MINLFEQFDKKTIVLYKSFKYAGIDRKTIVVEENGFLPDDVLSPYQFFSKNKTYTEQPLFFNQVKKPRFWQIEGSNNEAVIKNVDEIKARIIYRPNYKFRIVERVEWLNKNGHTQYIDYYNKHGFKYAQVVLNPKNHRRTLKHFFNDKGQIFMTENIITNDIMLNWKGKEYIFNSKVHFIIFYLRVNGIDSESFLINSFLTTAAVLNNLENAYNNTLFLQQDVNDNTINHLENLLSKNNQKYNIAVSNEEDYKEILLKIREEWAHKVFKSGYVYKFLKSNLHGNRVLTLTNSDQLPHISDIIEENPHLEFHIAALTEMSNVLLSLKQYDNVRLYPGAKKQKLVNLYKMCDVYLDINKGNEIMDSVRAAFDYKLLVLGYQELAHNLEVTHQENLFSLESYQVLCKTLKEVSLNEKQLNNRLKLQLTQAGAVDALTFKNSMKSKF